MKKNYIEFKVVGHSEELKEFVTLIQLIKSFGMYGMSRQINVHVDGDGSGRLDFFVKKEDNIEDDLPTFELDELHRLEKTTENKYTVYIGE